MKKKALDPHLYQLIRDIRLRLFEFADRNSLEALLIRTLDEAEELTGSSIGFLHFIEEDQENISLQAWSTRTTTRFCQALGTGLHYSVDDAGVWADCVREKKPVIHNDVASLPNQKGTPDGHAEVFRELVVPVIRQDRIVAILGIGNKKTEYDQDDLEAVSYLADVCWEIAEKKRASEALQHRVRQLRCLHGLSRLKEQQGLTREQLLQSAVELLPPAIPHPEVICARITLFNQEYTTVDFKETSWQQSAPILIKKEQVGLVTVFYRGEQPGSLSSYYKQEQELLDTFAESLGYYLERTGAHIELQEREHYLQKLLDTTMDGFWVLDSSGHIVEVNQAYCSMSGYSRDEIIGMGINDLDAEETPEFTEARIQCVRSIGSELFEARHRRKDGSIWDVEVSASWLDERGGQFICFCRDLTERKRLEKALMNEHQRQAFILDGSRAGTWEWNLQTGETIFNETWAALLGYTLDELKPTTFETWEALTHPDDLLAATDQIERYLAGETPHYECELRMLHKDGHWVWMLDRGQALVHDEEGNPLRMFGTHTNITHQKETEQNYRMLFREMLNGFSLHEIICDDQGNPVDYRFLAVNPAFERMTGLKASDIIGRTVLEVMPDTEPHWIDTYGRVALSGEPIFFENDSAAIDKSFEVVAFSPAAGQFATIFSDITQRKRAEEERREIQEQLNQARKMDSIGRLAGGVAHDFNNMLSVILGHMEIAMAEAGTNPALYSHLEEAHRAAERSADLTRQLLTFARKQTVSPKLLDINETIEGMLKLLRRLIGENIDLAWHPGHPGMIRIDPSQMDQILANLCVNARDAIVGHGQVTIKTSSAVLDETFLASYPDLKPGEFTLLSITDNGSGMDEETLSNIFEPFFTTKETGEGIGLGLATVYGIVKQNQGLINVYSEPGLGTTFNIYLPAFPEEPSQKELPKKPVDTGIQHTGTILLVEDESAILDVTRLMLEQMGLSVMTASSPEEGLSLAASHPEEIDLLITDVIMPSMNGRDLAEQVLKLQPNMKTLFISGYTADVISQRGVLEKGVHFLQKPYSRAALQEKINELLQSSRLKN